MAQSQKMVDCLVDSVLKLENFSAENPSNSTRLGWHLLHVLCEYRYAYNLYILGTSRNKGRPP